MLFKYRLLVYCSVEMEPECVIGNAADIHCQSLIALL